MSQYPWNHMMLWLCYVATSYDKLKPFHLQYNSFHRYQNWQDGDLPWAVPTDKVTEPFDYLIFQNQVLVTWPSKQVVLLDHLVRKHYVWTTTLPIITKLCWVVTYNKELSLMKVHNWWIRWYCEVTGQTKYFISSLPLDQWQKKHGRVITYRGWIAHRNWHDPWHM